MEKKPLNDKYTTAIFSGRFDPPHLGHIQTVLKLAKRYSKIVVVVLDYQEREIVGAIESKEVFDYLFDMVFPEIARSKVDVVVNDIHFGKITFAEYDAFLRNIGACYNHTVYLSGNPEVLANMERQQIKHEFVERSADSIYEGTKIREDLGLEFEKMDKIMVKEVVIDNPSKCSLRRGLFGMKARYCNKNDSIGQPIECCEKTFPIDCPLKNKYSETSDNSMFLSGD